MDLVEVLKRKHTLYPFDNELNILDFATFSEKMAEITPDLIIHTAAMTDVDACEIERDKALEVNGVGTQNVALAAKKCSAKILYISTDYVFDGTKGEPYIEFDEPRPLNNYGLSKLAGETYCMSLVKEFFIVRTSWMYGKQGHNFVSTVLKKARESERLEIVNDQIGSPTYSFDLAVNIGRLIDSERYGIYHLSGNGECSWFDFSRKIIEIAGMKVDVVPISTAKLNRPAVRPSYSVMRNFCIDATIGDEMPHWETSLRAYFEEREKEAA